MGSWTPGAQTVTDLLELQHLERIEVDERFVEKLLQDAEQTLESARALATSNPRVAYLLLYDAARLSMEAALGRQGLRPTARGGHTVAIDVLEAQLGRAGGAIHSMHRIRKRRNDAEYPYPDTPLIGTSEVGDDLPKAEQVVAMMRKFVGLVSKF